MCDPFTIAALAAVAVGSTMQYAGEKKAANARERTFNAERIRQQGLDKLQQARFKDSVAKTEEMVDPAAIAKAKGDREASLVAAIQPQGSASSYLPGAASAPAIVATANDSAQGAARGRTLDLASAIAALGGTGDQLQELNRGISRNSEEIDQLHGFKRGSMGALDAEMQYANTRGGGLRAAGSLAQQLGSAWLGSQMVPGAKSGAIFGNPSASMPVNGYGIPGIY